MHKLSFTWVAKNVQRTVDADKKLAPSGVQTLALAAEAQVVQRFMQASVIMRARGGAELLPRDTKALDELLAVPELLAKQETLQQL